MFANIPSLLDLVANISSLLDMVANMSPAWRHLSNGIFRFRKKKEKKIHTL